MAFRTLVLSVYILSECVYAESAFSWKMGESFIEKYLYDGDFIGSGYSDYTGDYCESDAYGATEHEMQELRNAKMPSAETIFIHAESQEELKPYKQPE